MKGGKNAEIKVEFKKASDYRIIPVTGAWGGVSPQGEIIFDLFVEKLEVQSIRINVEPGRSPVEIKISRVSISVP